MAQCLTPFLNTIRKGVFGTKHYSSGATTAQLVFGRSPLRSFYNHTYSLYNNCGKCENCKLTKRNQWAFRIYEESKRDYLYSTFLTLTYTDHDLICFDTPHYRKLYKFTDPLKYAILCPGHHKDFIHAVNARLKKTYGRKVAYYMIGEYGSLEHRPHMHYVFFSPAPEDITKQIITDCWYKISKGSIIDFQNITFADITYCAKHNLKECGGNKFQNEFSPIFQRCSKGLGLDYLLENISAFADSSSSRSVVLNNFNIGFPHYYTKKLNAFINIQKEFTPFVKNIIDQYNLLPKLLNFPELQKCDYQKLAELEMCQRAKEFAICEEFSRLTNNPLFTYHDYLKIQRGVQREKHRKFIAKQKSKLIIKQLRYASQRKYRDYKKVTQEYI